MVSIVIPTYRRKESLIRLLGSITKQTHLPKETIVVAAGYTQNELDFVPKKYNNTRVLQCTPSVCKQRNFGVQASTCDYVLVCDDDIELPKNYLQKLTDYLKKHPDINIVTGTEFIADEQGNWDWVNITISNKRLVFNYIFSLSIWSDLHTKKTASNPLIRAIAKRYSGNGISKAGWPLLTSFAHPVMKTSVYGLGCSIIRREMLLKNPYNEDLDSHGIGDNYEMALKINGKSQKLHVLRTVGFYHHKEKSNRQPKHKSYLLRCKSLEGSIRKLPYFGFNNRLYFIWSLIGNGLAFFVRGHFKLWWANTKVLLLAIKNLFVL